MFLYVIHTEYNRKGTVTVFHTNISTTNFPNDVWNLLLSVVHIDDGVRRCEVKTEPNDVNSVIAIAGCSCMYRSYFAAN